MRLLHVDSSIQGPNSASRSLTATIVANLRARHPGAQVTYRDLSTTPLRPLAPDHLAAAQPGAAIGLTPDLQADLLQGQTSLDEFLAADTIVIGAPMYNFSIPSQLKAWIDRLAAPGKTFRYGPNGPEGLARGKRVIIASSRGGHYSQPPLASLDHQEAYLRSVFSFFGITDITFIRAEGLAISTHRDTALASAQSAAAALA